MPTLDDVFVAKTGRRLEAEGAEEQPAAGALAGVTLALRQTGALARRSVTGTLRTPQALFPSLFFPLVLMAIFTASFGNAPGNIPGFPPVRSFLDFALAGAIVQGILIGGTSAGAGLRAGHRGRLLRPPRRLAGLAHGDPRRPPGRRRDAGDGPDRPVRDGRASSSAPGSRAGVAGVLILLLLAALMAVAVSGLGIILALRTGSAEAVQGTFPLFFVLLFFSSAFFPRETMTGWFRAVADVNPISYLVEAMRDLVIDGIAPAPDADRAGRGARAGGRLGRRPATWPSGAGWRRRRDGTLLGVSAGLAWRSLILVRRMPSVFLPSLVMPLFILVATSGAFRGISLLPAFEGASYLAFTIPLALVMGAGFAGMNAGMTLARDIEGGFADRLIVSPAPRITLIAGPLVAAGLRSLFTTTVVLIAGPDRRRRPAGRRWTRSPSTCSAIALLGGLGLLGDGRRAADAHDPGRAR